MKVYTIRKMLRRVHQKSTADCYPQEIGPFTSRFLAEQTLAAVAVHPEVEYAHIVQTTLEEETARD